MARSLVNLTRGNQTIEVVVETDAEGLLENVFLTDANLEELSEEEIEQAIERS